jgi:hypothetical protein
MPQVYDPPRQPSTRAAAPPAPREPTGATLPEPRPSAWKLRGLGVKEVARRVIHEIPRDECLGWEWITPGSGSSAPIPSDLRGEPAATPGRQRDLPGADAAHSPINSG